MALSIDRSTLTRFAQSTISNARAVLRSRSPRRICGVAGSVLVLAAVSSVDLACSSGDGSAASQAHAGASGTANAGAGTGGATNVAGSSADGGKTSSAGNASTDDGGSSGSDAAGSAGASGADTGGASGAAGQPGVDPACTLRSIDDNASILVAPSGSDADPECGGRLRPCKTIQKGIDRAAALKRSKVYVAAGKYVEQITLKASVFVEGAWQIDNANWTPICTPHANKAVIIEAPASANITVKASALTGSTGLAYVAVQSKSVAAAGESLYGIFADGKDTTLVLDTVSVQTTKAGAGIAGTKGKNGSAPAATCGTGDGSNGAVVQNATGTAAPEGTFGSQGYVPSQGGNGKPGNMGQPGTKGTPECLNCVQCELETDGDAAICLSKPDSPTKRCGADGIGGCPGGAPDGGLPGKGGGSSIGIYIWDASLKISNSSVTSGDAGDGGDGGPTGDIAQGADGQMGADGGKCAVSCKRGTIKCCPKPECDMCPVCLGVPAAVAPKGGVGTKGGASSAGGKGGGGAGGFSYAIFKGSSAKLESTNNALLHGKAGVSVGNGSAGKAAPTN